ncbi:hypothetical protein AVEN_219175-1 [Araneus ventricosus]|uniref:Integrase p58-like C-terminal domain-containing protein n=1 Tax=Araneus ventricosus TaxID=182803 RepID=A0A4Y2HVM8_ARAVE|nr:hypothetical protein AVEN_219175-1 [Araneus ventricosus]
MKTRYDSGATGHYFMEGDQVWMYTPKRRRGLSLKLQQNWEGPYTIVKKLNDVIYRVQKSPNAKPKVIRINRLTPTGLLITVRCNETAGTSVFEEGSSVTNMESRFPAMQVLWLGRVFYKVKHEVTSATVIAPLTLATNLATILAIWRQIWRPWRQIDDSRKCKPFLDISTRKGNTRENTM